MNYRDRHILEAIHWLVSRLPGHTCSRDTLYALFFLADRYHIRKYGRPAVGWRYVAKPNGPVNTEVEEFLLENTFREPIKSR